MIIKVHKHNRFIFLGKRLLVALLSIVFFQNNAGAQDFHLSQYDASPMYLNPSMTGMFDGEMRVFSNYRSQWASIIPNPFTTVSVSGDMALKQMGAGVQIMNSRAGSGSYNTFSFLASGAYDFLLDQKKAHHLAMGIQAGFIQKSLKISQLTFNNQFLNSNGSGFNNNLPSGEVYADQSATLPAANFGFFYYYGDVESKFNPFIGAAADHIFGPKESILNTGSRLGTHVIVHGGTKINFSSKIQLIPRLLYMQQKNAREIAGGAVLHYFIKESRSYLLTGADYRLNDAVIVHLGVKNGSFLYRFSYDINTSSLKAVTGGRGASEISVTYIAKKKKQVTTYTCPRL